MNVLKRLLSSAYATFSRYRPKTLKSFLVAAVVIFIVLPIINGKVSDMYANASWDDDADRGAITGVADLFNDRFERIYPNDDVWDDSQAWQNWSPEDSMWFYTTTQGSDLMPYDFFMVLEQATSQELFRSNDNMNYYRYIPLKPTRSNPDGLALGFVKDTYGGSEYVGFTCAACHTAQINYQGVGMRIDGGPAMSDIYNFLRAVSEALRATSADEAKRDRFVTAVMERNGWGEILTGGRNFSSPEQVLQALKTFTNRLANYNSINHSSTRYGYARLDAFGRIYNRVLEAVLNEETIKDALADQLPIKEVDAVLADIDSAIIGPEEFVSVFEKVQRLLTVRQMLRIRDALFNKPNAPVSYPFLWDTPQHDYVQWNGIVANGGLGPVGRNAGEVIGVFGTLDLTERSGFSLSALIGGQSAWGTHIRYQTSINVRNLRHLENRLTSLQSPKWPEDVLPEIDRESAARGRKLFLEPVPKGAGCSRCHLDIDRSAEDRRVIAQMLRLNVARTDPRMARNGVNYGGKSGILKNTYVSVDVGSVLLQDTAPAAVLLTAVTTKVLTTPDYDKGWVRRWSDRMYDLVSALLSNPIESSIKAGNYNPDTTAKPFDSLLAYKARPLNGIWATAPYLHNGSVPTLYDLLRPKRQEGDPEDGEYRPDEFRTGSREFDPEKVGFISQGYGSETPAVRDGTRFLTSLPGNNNTGHEYGSRLSPDQLKDLLEYLKTL